MGIDASHDKHDKTLNNDDPKPALENREMVPGANEWQDVGIADITQINLRS